MKTTRRGLLAGALAVPTIAGLASWQWKYNSAATGANAALLHDNSLAAGRRFADAGKAAGGQTTAIEGDAIRFAQSVVQMRPALIAGVSRHAEALLIAEVAGEAGYALATEFRGTASGCEGFCTSPGWNPLNRMAVNAGTGWVEALASWASNPQATDLPAPRQIAHAGDPGTVLGWVLVPRA